MIRLISIALALVAGLGLAGKALTAEVDMSKLTCKDVGDMPAAKTIGVAMWVNGPLTFLYFGCVRLSHSA
jgi:acid stress chaperone HdeB